jgi:hypothetical protein
MQRRPWPEMNDPVKEKEKAIYAPTQRMKEGMSAAEKQGINVWNNWHDILTANGLMQDKPEK